jgi:hypothetical protein
MTRLQEAQEWAGRLVDAFFIDHQDGPAVDSPLKWTLHGWQLNERAWAETDMDTRLLALAFAVTAPKSFR